MVTPTAQMGKKNKKSQRRSGGDHVRIPLFYDFATTGTSLTNVSTITEAYDKNRAFRIAGAYGEIIGVKNPVFVQFEIYGGPDASSDNKIASPCHLVGTAVPFRLRMKCPPTRSTWYPANVSEATRICQLVNICTNKDRIGGVKALIYLVIQLGPYEPPDTCPAVQSFTPDDPEDAEVPQASLEAIRGSFVT